MKAKIMLFTMMLAGLLAANPAFGDCCPRGSLDDDLFLGFRAYVEPETGVGPNWFEILWDRAIHFKK